MGSVSYRFWLYIVMKIIIIRKWSKKVLYLIEGKIIAGKKSYFCGIFLVFTPNRFFKVFTL